ncbi:Fatty acyl-coenzyme A reductase [Theobroma cacao]|nr:Fatty acyl-coenzyme A reductase [Theobroma cacao]
MESGSVLQFLDNKSIFVIGATGFLAKIFVEKILRVQPNVKKLYLLLRAEDSKSATQRFHNEIIGKELFKVLKEKWGNNFNSFISEKIAVVPGDISHEDLGLKNSKLEKELRREVDVVVNSAATTNFDERYDVALGLNVLGAKHVLDFAKKCAKLKVFVHVSTAYVAGEKSGLILESSFSMGKTLNGVSGLDINVEMKVAEEELKQLQAQGASEKEITLVMKDLGAERARLFGWPNTYVFTKAMGEMLVGNFKGDLPLVIVRPTIVTSTFKEPFPGWIEGLRTIDSVIVGLGKGKITCFLGNPKVTVDLIPADMVINAMIVTMMMAHANQSCDDAIYHVGSSLRNPMNSLNVHNFSYHYFTKNPLIDRNGKPTKTRKLLILSTMSRFRLYMKIRYSLPLKGLYLLSKLCPRYFTNVYNINHHKIKSVMRLAELYRPYVFFKGIFDDINLGRLRMVAKESGMDLEVFNFDPRFIEWEEYFMKIHIPGLTRHVIRC